MYLIQKKPFIFALIFFAIACCIELIVKPMYWGPELFLILFTFLYAITLKVSLSPHFKGWASIYLATFSVIFSLFWQTLDIDFLKEDLQAVSMPAGVKNVLMALVLLLGLLLNLLLKSGIHYLFISIGNWIANHYLKNKRIEEI